MKIKQQPADFQVDELSEFATNGGEYSVYRLTKQSIGTPEVVNAIVDRWRIPRHRIQYGGLKDKHAVTTQTITIQHGPKKPLSQQAFELEYLGKSKRAFTAGDIAGNRFDIVIRDLRDSQVEPMQTTFDSIRKSGLPNYFDDQRFGSLGHSRDWIAKAWCLGDYERALWLALADTHPDDRSKEKQEKRLLQAHWGKWQECKQALSKSHRRSVVTFLADKEHAGKPLDFKRAFACINVDLRGLYLSAFQSALWNRALARLIEQAYANAELPALDLESGRAVFPPFELPADQPEILTSVPLPCARLRLDDEDPALHLLQEIAGEEDMELRGIRVKFPRDSFFSKASRETLIKFENADSSVGIDALQPKRKCMQLTFDLPRGAYATMLIKRLGLADAS